MPPEFYATLLPRAAPGLLVLCAVLLGGLLWLWRRPRRLLKLRRERGLRGEEQAMELLGRAGYAIVAAQHPGGFAAEVDGELWRFALRADFLVRRRRDGRLFVAEVKTGELAPRLQHGPTRRQLLEYSLAYRQEVSGVLLVVPEEGAITCVSFPALLPLARGMRRRFFAVVLGAGLLALGALAHFLYAEVQSSTASKGYGRPW